MPLVVICGRPGTGKTRFAGVLADYLVSAGVSRSNISILNDEALGGKDRRAGYASEMMRCSTSFWLIVLTTWRRGWGSTGFDYIKSGS